MSDSGLPFIPAALDDAGLTPAQFRVLCRISRRGICNEAVPNIAAGCGLCENTVWRALKDLLALQMIARESRHGQTSFYSVAPLESWKQPAPSNGVPQKKRYPFKRGGGTPFEGVGGTPFEGALRVSHEGNTIRKGFPSRSFGKAGGGKAPKIDHSKGF